MEKDGLAHFKGLEELVVGFSSESTLGEYEINGMWNNQILALTPPDELIEREATLTSSIDRKIRFDHWQGVVAMVSLVAGFIMSYESNSPFYEMAVIALNFFQLPFASINDEHVSQEAEELGRIKQNKEIFNN